MLVLTRKFGETIHIGSDIIIYVGQLDIRPERRCVKIGIEAPRDVKILRGELVQQEADRAALDA